MGSIRTSYGANVQLPDSSWQAHVAEEKNALLRLLQNEFGMSKKETTELTIASAFSRGMGEHSRTVQQNFIKPSLSQFAQDQASSAAKLLDEVCAIDAAGAEFKHDFLKVVKCVLSIHTQSKCKWDGSKKTGGAMPSCLFNTRGFAENARYSGASPKMLTVPNDAH